MARPCIYIARLTPTAVTAAKTLIQIKAVTAGGEILDGKLWQTNKTASEQWDIQCLRKSAAATVTAFTPLRQDLNDPASLWVGSTSGTGINASAEGTDGEITGGGGWNILNGEWWEIPIPDVRTWLRNGDIWALKLNTAPAASTTIGGYVRWAEYQ